MYTLDDWHRAFQRAKKDNEGIQPGTKVCIDSDKPQLYGWCAGEEGVVREVYNDQSMVDLPFGKDGQSTYGVLVSNEHLTLIDVATPPPVPTACQHERKYLNIISANLKFYVCPDCGKDLGDE